MYARSKSLLFAVLLVIGNVAFTPPAHAQDAPAARQTRFALADCTTSKIVLRVISKGPPVAIRTREITSSDKDVPASSQRGWTINWDTPVASDSKISEYLSNGTSQQACPRWGSFKVELDVYLKDAGGAPSPLTIWIDRIPDPILDAPSTATLLTMRHPRLRSDDNDNDNKNDDGHGHGEKDMTFVVREASGVASIAKLTASLGQLKDSAGKFTASELSSAQSVYDIAPGAIVPLKFNSTTALPPGAYTTRTTLRSPSLKQDQNVDLTVWVKIYSGYLWGMIFVGIILGQAVNVRMQQRSALDAAKLDALRANEGFVRSAAAQKDPVVQQALVSLAAKTQNDIQAAAVLEDVQTALQNAQAEAAAIEARATAALQTFETKLVSLRAKLQPNGLQPDPDIARCLEPVNKTVNHIEVIAASGQVEDAQAQLQNFQLQGFQPAVLAALHPWLVQLHGTLGELGEWSSPAQTVQSVCGDIDRKIGAAYGVGDPAQLISQVNDIALQLRPHLAFTIPEGMAAAFRAAAVILDAGGKIDLSQSVRAQTDNMLLPRASDAGMLVTLDGFAKSRTRIETLLRSAVGQPQAIEPSLTQGDFPGAARIIVPPAAALTVAMAHAPMLPPLVRPYAGLQNPAAAPPLLRMNVPPRMAPGKAVDIELLGLTADPLDVAWSCEPQGGGAIAGTWQKCVLTPERIGFLTIKVGSSNLRTGASACVFVGNVMQQPDYRKLARQSRWLRHALALFIAMLTAFAGYQLFAASWFGTLSDFLAAFVWGFFGQFGLERVRDISKPILAKTLA
ncbi:MULTISPECIES: hypothetical protein [unclassified Caballeronia]|uniref:hypothetical protein n=1 Tax=unclassified Caballeronia TaxID=2646786 RepID=UPI00285DEE8F|nr:MULTISPECIES: hypothetical protein [unclassified Caballeronia]MDR5753011.1 hypothetical protein [Caballeronia sp. LZ024]MDR5845091.1 hypothetical protein [Caballeronia sp. LZ031]